VVEQQGFHHALQQVHQVVAAAHVRQFVREQRLYVFHRQLREQRGGYDHHRAQPAGGDRGVDGIAQAQRHRRAQAHAHRQFVEASLPTRIGQAHAGAQSTDPMATEQQSQREQQRARRPGRDDRRQLRLQPRAPVEPGCRVGSGRGGGTQLEVQGRLRADAPRDGRGVAHPAPQPQQGQREAGAERDARQAVACLRSRIAQRQQAERSQRAHRQALPEEFDQRPAERRDHRGRRHHSCSSRNAWISARSAALRWPRRAAITSSLPEPA
jgi:hypothetical protein